MLAGDRLWTALYVVGGLLAAAVAALGLIIGFSDDWDSNGERALWFLFTLAGALLLAAGLLSRRRGRGLAATLMIVGAVLCGIAVFWSIIVPLAAIAVVVMTIMWLRRPAVI